MCTYVEWIIHRLFRSHMGPKYFSFVFFNAVSLTERTQLSLNFTFTPVAITKRTWENFCQVWRISMFLLNFPFRVKLGLFSFSIRSSLRRIRAICTASAAHDYYNYPFEDARHCTLHSLDSEKYSQLVTLTKKNHSSVQFTLFLAQFCSQLCTSKVFHRKTAPDEI